jgi:hypothetical protein
LPRPAGRVGRDFAGFSTRRRIPVRRSRLTETGPSPAGPGELVVHGEPGPAAALADRVTRELDWNVSVPAYQERVTLD